MRQKYKAFFLAVLLTALVGALVVVNPAAMAQDRPAAPLPNTVWVGADGKFDSDPDTALVQFGISAQEEKLQDATQKATQAAEQIRQLLRSTESIPATRRSAASPPSLSTTTRMPSASWWAIGWMPTSASS